MKEDSQITLNSSFEREMEKERERQRERGRERGEGQRERKIILWNTWHNVTLISLKKCESLHNHSLNSEQKTSRNYCAFNPKSWVFGIPQCFVVSCQPGEPLMKTAYCWILGLSSLGLINGSPSFKTLPELRKDYRIKVCPE